MCRMKLGLSALAFLALPASTLAEGADDPVIGMCAGIATPDACECAAEALREQTDEADYTLYETIGGHFLTRVAKGEPHGDAWSAAVEDVSAGSGMTSTETMTKTNEIGKAHRAAIKSCSG